MCIVPGFGVQENKFSIFFQIRRRLFSHFNCTVFYLSSWPLFFSEMNFIIYFSICLLKSRPEKPKSKIQVWLSFSAKSTSSFQPESHGSARKQVARDHFPCCRKNGLHAELDGSLRLLWPVICALWGTHHRLSEVLDFPSTSQGYWGVQRGKQ